MPVVPATLETEEEGSLEPSSLGNTVRPQQKRKKIVYPMNKRKLLSHHFRMQSLGYPKSTVNRWRTGTRGRELQGVRLEEKGDRKERTELTHISDEH